MHKDLECLIGDLTRSRDEMAELGERSHRVGLEARNVLLEIRRMILGGHSTGDVFKDFSLVLGWHEEEEEKIRHLSAVIASENKGGSQILVLSRQRDGAFSYERNFLGNLSGQNLCLEMTSENLVIPTSMYVMVGTGLTKQIDVIRGNIRISGHDYPSMSVLVGGDVLRWKDESEEHQDLYKLMTVELGNR